MYTNKIEIYAKLAWNFFNQNKEITLKVGQNWKNHKFSEIFPPVLVRMENYTIPVSRPRDRFF